EAALLAAARFARRQARASEQAPAAMRPAPLLPPSLRAPVPPTALIGREELLTRVYDLLHGQQRRQTRVLTLVGAGGVGKTHLALAAAQREVRAFPGGVAFVALAPLHDARWVPTAIAGVLGVTDNGALPLMERIAEALRERAPLLLLDNVEHLLPDAAAV